MRHTAILPALLCVAACASAQPQRQELYPSASVGSGYSGYGLQSSEPTRTFQATGIGMSRELEAGLVARPDLLMMEVRIEKDDATAGRALGLAQAAAADLTARLQQATSAAATFTPCGTKVTPLGGPGKAAGPTEAFKVTIEGRIELPLQPELDYWKRSALVVALAELTDRYEAARAAKTADKGVWLTRPRVVVKDAETYRAKLTELWVKRARAFAAAAQAHEAPLYLLDCAPPGDIVQKERSLEEIGLSLSVSCRLGSLKAPPGAAAR